MSVDTPMTTVAAADFLGLSRSTVEKLRHFGGGPRYYKLGHLVRYRATDLEEWMAERQVGSTSEQAGRAAK